MLEIAALRPQNMCTFSTPWKRLPKSLLLDMWTKCSKRESNLKRHNNIVKHQLEGKRMKIVTENMEQSTTLWTTTAPEVRYLGYIDHRYPESCALQSLHTSSLFLLPNSLGRPSQSSSCLKGKVKQLIQGLDMECTNRY